MGESEKPSCFVITPFGEPWDRYFARIYAPAIEQAGLSAIRADDVFRAGSILQDIVEMLYSSTVVLADISENNRNVHYELGLAHALGKPTVLVGPKASSLFFDVGQERLLTYDKDNESWGNDLREKVRLAIAETMRSPATAIPTAFLHIKPARTEVDEVSLRLRRIEELLTEIAREVRSGSVPSSRAAHILKSSLAAEARAEDLLSGADPAEVVRSLQNEGYGEAMAEHAVALSVARLRKSGPTS